MSSPLSAKGEADAPRRRYELQVEANAQGRGVGKALMELLHHTAKDWRMDKAMLTVFKSELATRPSTFPSLIVVAS